MLQDPSFWTAIAFIVFIALVSKPIGKAATAALDKRANKIEQDLNEAERLREEAQELLANYQKKQRDAQREAEDIVTQAKEEAERIAKQGQERLAASLERREQQAMDRIKQAESQAVDQVRAHAVDVAIAATRAVLEKQVEGDRADKMIADAIDDLPNRLH